MDKYELDQIMEETETFRGEDVNLRKMETLSTLRSLAEQVAKYDPEIKATPLPVIDTRQHSGVQIEMPRFLHIRNKSVISALAEFVEGGDALSFAGLDNGHILITSSVENMWDQNANAPDGIVWTICCELIENPAFTYQYEVNAPTRLLAIKEAQNKLPKGYRIIAVER